MEVIKNEFNIKNNLTQGNNPNIIQDENHLENQQYYTGNGQDYFQNNEDLINYDTRILNDNNINNNNNINIEINDLTKKNKKTFTPQIYDKICSYINDLKEIDKIVPFCEERNRKELLLDRGLLLCLKVNEIMDEYNTNINIILYYKNNDNIQFDVKLLDENYWMNQKVDKYARTEQRKRIPQERWFMLKDNSFTPNLNKCFALNRGKFIDNYNWLNSLE